MGQRAQRQQLETKSAYAEALARCSGTLLTGRQDHVSRLELLNSALEPLRVAARASRAYLFENFDDPEEGFCSGIRAEACAPGVPPNLSNPNSQKIPWSAAPEQNRTLLANGRPVGGPIEETFAGKPEIIAWLQNLKIASVLFLPIHIDGAWWGYVGFDDCNGPREWYESDVALLQAAAQMFGSTLQRWQVNEALETQYRYQRALARCSQILLNNPSGAEQERHLLEEALYHLMQAVDASRAYVARNFVVPEIGPCLGIFAEVCAPGVLPDIENPGNRRFPWSRLPQTMHDALAAGRPFGGPVAEAFASTPALLAGLGQHRNPLLSVQNFPIHFADRWWGLVGFDDVVTARSWNEGEITVLRTAAEMLSSALQRWEGLQLLEHRVEERTSDLIAINRRLLAEIEQRQRAEAGLARRLEVEHALATFSTRLLEQRSATQALRETLQGLGEIVNARRVMLVFLSPESSPFDRQSFQWHAPDEESLASDVLGRFITSCPWLWQQLLAGKMILLKNLSELPAEAQADRAFLAGQSIRSLLLFPMMVGKQLTAVLSCTNFNDDVNKQPENLRVLQVGADLVENMLRREAVLATLEQRVADRTQELTTLFDIIILAGEAGSLPEVLEPAVQHIAKLDYCQAICIHLLSPEEDTLTLLAQRGVPEPHLTQLSAIRIAARLRQLLKRSKQELLVGRLPDLAVTLPDELKLPQFQFYFGSQLRTQGKAIGLLSAYRVGDVGFSLSQISLLDALAEQLGLAVENHNLQRKTKEAAILGERQRLARELHDSITQSMYSQVLFARAGRYAVEDGDAAKVDESLAQLENSTLAALKEMRLLLFQLRPFTLEGMSLEQAIEERFDDLERRLGIDATCHFETDYPFEANTVAELYRVVMEALNNALKHSAATHVSVQLQRRNEAVCLTVADNGVGFEVHNVRMGMGLETMRQRVAQIDGRLTIDAAPGAGTRVVLQLPATTF